MLIATRKSIKYIYQYHLLIDIGFIIATKADMVVSHGDKIEIDCRTAPAKYLQVVLQDQLSVL